jgi:hypothetical protein
MLSIEGLNFIGILLTYLKDYEYWHTGKNWFWKASNFFLPRHISAIFKNCSSSGYPKEKKAYRILHAGKDTISIIAKLFRLQWKPRPRWIPKPPQ